MLKHYMNPLFSVKEQLEMCDGEVQFWKECYEHQKNERERLEDKLVELQLSLALIKEAMKLTIPPVKKEEDRWWDVTKNGTGPFGTW